MLLAFGNRSIGRGFGPCVSVKGEIKNQVLVVQLLPLEVDSVVKDEEETKCVSLFHPKISLPLWLRLPCVAQGKPFHLGFPPKQPSVTLRSQFNSNAKRKDCEQELISPTEVNYRAMTSSVDYISCLMDHMPFWWRFIRAEHSSALTGKRGNSENFMPSCTQWYLSCIQWYLMVQVRET